MAGRPRTKPFEVRYVLFFAVIGVLGTIPAVAADPVKPTTAAVTAYQQGQSYERLFEDVNLAPGPCGVVLERAQCASDLANVASARGPDATDAAVRKWFASGDVALRVQNWNGMFVPDQTWSEDPVFGWWYTAGVVSIAASLPRDLPLDEYLGHYADQLRKHASAAPDDSPKWVPAAGDPVAALTAMQSSLQVIFPVAPFPEVASADTAAVYVQLGIYQSTLQQLVDSPPALSRPESRAFASAVLARLQALHAKFADGLTAAPLQAAVYQPILLDPRWIDKTWRQPLSQSMNTKWPKAPREQFMLGALVAQVAYNAAVLKDEKSDSTFRGVISSLPPWPGIGDKARAGIAALESIPSIAKGGTWGAINAAASTAVLDIVAEN